MYTKQEIIIRSYREGKSQRQISRELKISRKTVKKYIDEYNRFRKSETQQAPAFSTYLSKKPTYNVGVRDKICLTQDVQLLIDKFLEANKEKMQSGMRKQVLKKIDIFQHLQEQGITIGYTTICNYIREKEGKSTTKEAYIRQEYEPGSTCEFDWGEIKLTIANQQHRFQMAVFTSAYSNYRYAVFYKRQDTLAFMESHVSFFKHIGGVYHQMVYDNMRVAVAKFIGKHEKEPTQSLIQLKEHYQFSHRFCNAYRGNEKGHVERSVEYIRRKAFGFKSNFNNFEEAEKHLESTISKINLSKQQLTGRTAMEMFSEEKDVLWQSPRALACSDSVQLRVDKYATISYCNNRYSVSEKLVGCFVDVKISSHKIEAYYENTQVASHQRNYGSHQWIILIDHYLNTLKQKPGALRGSVALSSSPYLKKLYQEYYADTPRDFIDLLHYCRNYNVSIKKLEATVSKLVDVCPKNITSEQITALLGNKSSEDICQIDNENDITDLANNHLKQATALLN